LNFFVAIVSPPMLRAPGCINIARPILCSPAPCYSHLLLVGGGEVGVRMLQWVCVWEGGEHRLKSYRYRMQRRRNHHRRHYHHIIIVIIAIIVIIRILPAQRRIRSARVADRFSGVTATPTAERNRLHSAVVLLTYVYHVTPVI
jgi:hypothetical protein